MLLEFCLEFVMLECYASDFFPGIYLKLEDDGTDHDK